MSYRRTFGDTVAIPAPAVDTTSVKYQQVGAGIANLIASLTNKPMYGVTPFTPTPSSGPSMLTIGLVGGAVVVGALILSRRKS